MLLAIFFIITNAIFRGSLNYLTLHYLISIGLIIGILMSNSLLLIISSYGKVGYYPFFSVLSMLFYNSSYLFILFDLINKWAYFSSFALILNASSFFRCSEYRLILINLMIIIYPIRLINSAKHIIFISSYLLFISIYLLLATFHYLFSYLFLLFYIDLFITVLIKCNFLYVHWIIPILHRYSQAGVGGGNGVDTSFSLGDSSIHAPAAITASSNGERGFQAVLGWYQHWGLLSWLHVWW